ncbi:MAG: LuxR C-terminal-related transcriptional regulator [Desulfobacterales bacterium]
MLIKAYSDVSVTRSGVRNDRVCDLNWGAYFKFDVDIRELFPYINGTVHKARYRLHPLHVQFSYQSVFCTLYPLEAMVAPLRGKDHALDFIEDLVVFLNDLHARRDKLPPSHKIYQQPASIVDILKALPRTNCRNCGYATCQAFAAALRNGEAAAGDCPDFANPISVFTIYPVLGPEGTIVSTFAIESDLPISESEPARGEDKSPAPNKPSSATAHTHQALYDQFGIRIQSALTPREIQVLRLLADGASNPDISEQLNISPHTVKSHVIHIFNKLNVNDRTQAAVWAVQNGLV